MEVGGRLATAQVEGPSDRFFGRLCFALCSQVPPRTKTPIKKIEIRILRLCWAMFQVAPKVLPESGAA